MTDLKGEWLQTKLEARLWWCEDNVCDCHQPQIDRIKPNMEAGYPWIRRENVWRGTYTWGGEDMDKLRAELLEAANAHGISVDLDGYGVLVVS